MERFNRTASEQLLRALDGASHVDPADGALTLRHWLERYNDTPHQTLGGDTPRQRWEAGRALRFPDDDADLYRRFVVRLRGPAAGAAFLSILPWLSPSRTPDPR